MEFDRIITVVAMISLFPLCIVIWYLVNSGGEKKSWKGFLTWVRHEVMGDERDE